MWASEGASRQDQLSRAGVRVGSVGEAVRDGAALSRVGEQPECQRVAPAQLQQPLPARCRDADLASQFRAVGLVEVPKGMDR